MVQKTREREEDIVVGKYTIRPSDPNYAGYKALMQKTSPEELERHLTYKENIGKIENRITREAYLIELGKAFNFRKSGKDAEADAILSNLDRFLKNRGILESKPVPTEKAEEKRMHGEPLKADSGKLKPKAKGITEELRAREGPGGAANIAESTGRRAKEERGEAASEEWAVPAAGGVTATSRQEKRTPRASEEETIPRPRVIEQPTHYDPLTFARINDVESAWHFESYDGKREIYFDSSHTEEELKKYLLGRGLTGNACKDGSCTMIAPEQKAVPKKEAPKAEAKAVAAGQVLHATEDTFSEMVLNSKEPVIVDYWASWCGPCKQLGPVLERVAAEYGIKVVKVNVDEEPGLSNGISSIPALHIYKDGVKVASEVGFMGKEEVVAWFTGAAR
ncbi:MAG: thioredoxin domain-containing protein [Candidatus Micrarchaeia archaeon]|jgi:thioredoxin 1